MDGFGSEIERRVEAVRLVRDAGMPVADAAGAVGRSRQWLSKWLARDRAGEPLEDRSRASATSFQPFDPSVVELVIGYRDRLENDPISSIGGLAILAAMERDRVTPLPSIRTINGSSPIRPGHGLEPGNVPGPRFRCCHSPKWGVLQRLPANAAWGTTRSPAHRRVHPILKPKSAVDAERQILGSERGRSATRRR